MKRILYAGPSDEPSKDPRREQKMITCMVINDFFLHKEQIFFVLSTCRDAGKIPCFGVLSEYHNLL